MTIPVMDDHHILYYFGISQIQIVPCYFVFLIDHVEISTTLDHSYTNIDSTSYVYWNSTRAGQSRPPLRRVVLFHAATYTE